METNIEKTELYPPARRWWRDLLLGLTLFLCGMLVGAAVTARIAANRVTTLQQQGMDINKTITRLERLLDLDAKQSTQVQRILKSGMKDLRQLREGVRPQVDETLERVRTEIAAILNEEQKKNWDEHFDTIRKRWFPPQSLGNLPKRGKPNTE